MNATRRLAWLLLVLPLAAAARFEFGVVGDAPYTSSEEAKLRKVVEAMNAAPLSFVVHVGDLHTDARGQETSPCTDAMLANRRAMLDASRHPVVVTPGDNDWTDCHGGKPPVDPLKRLDALRRVFFAEGATLGQRKLEMKRQPRFPENARWVQEDVLLFTLHMVGSNNNLGRSPEADAEHAERMAAGMAWMKEAFEEAERGGHKAVVIFTQANPYFEDRWPQSRRPMMRIAPPPDRPTGFRAFMAALEVEVAAWERPVLFVHGDTHYFRIDKPLFDPSSGRIFQGFTRVESFGSPYVGWVRVVVDTSKAGVFEFKADSVGD